LHCHWQGNKRESRSGRKRAVLLSRDNRLSVENLPQEIIRAGVEINMNDPGPIVTDDLKSYTEKTEKDVILMTLQKVKYNKSKAARILNIDRKTLYNKIRLYGILFE
jgi:two-component system, NtrC family, response regulator HydG